MNHFIKTTIVLLLFLCIKPAYAQNELNPYKYIIIPKQYDFLKEVNQFRVNSTTKYLFEQEGYQAFYQGDEYPDDLKANYCLAVTAVVLDDSSTFTTKLTIVMRNCYDKEVFRTMVGKSKIKQYDKTYIDALKKCFVSIRNLNYTFEESLVVNANLTAERETKTVNTAAAQQEIEKVEDQEKAAVQAAPSSTDASASAPAAVAVIPVAVPTNPEPESIEAEENATVMPEESGKSEVTTMARAFKNENITFLLVNQGAQLQAYVSESKNENYKPGELIGTFRKTSLPNVYRVSWKKPQKGVDETTAYFDDEGNLKIDILRNDKIEVLTFTEVK